MKFRLLIAALLLYESASLSGQEVIRGLISNPGVKKAWQARNKKKSILVSDTLSLPFFDDFSGPSILPDSTRWQDFYVMINNTYSVKQRSLGVATFDAIDNTGSLYADASSLGFEADHLTSRPIDLGYAPADSIYLSFLYEPGGIADMPELQDSLTLQFYSPASLSWFSVWKAPYSSTDTVRIAMIPVTDTRFLQKGFMFRFINYASLSPSGTDQSMMGNCDQWNVDYVYLGKNRNINDTIIRDVAMTLPVRSALKNYESMPWTHFRQFFLTELGPSYNFSYFNSDTTVRNVTRYFDITDVYRDSLDYSRSGGALNISPLTTVTYNGPLIYTFNTPGKDSALFRIRGYLEDDLASKQNDTIIYYQEFADYYSYDDGSSEAGYGINGLGSRNAMVAQQYSVYAPDTLRGIKICFNESYQDANYATFSIGVWDDNNGVPGNLIASENNLSVNQGPGLNGFRTFYLTSPVAVSGTYYAGWMQNSETYMNAGLDLNTRIPGKQFYYLNGDWNSSQANGCVMIRPVFGKRRTITGIADVTEAANRIKIWPNPAGDFINIEFRDSDPAGDRVVIIRDLQGRELIKSIVTGRMDISALSPGVYVLEGYSGGKAVGFVRLLKIR